MKKSAKSADLKRQLETELTKLIQAGYQLKPDQFIYPFERKDGIITGHFSIGEQYYRFIKSAKAIEVLKLD